MTDWVKENFNWIWEVSKSPQSLICLFMLLDTPSLIALIVGMMHVRFF
jgi:hypothetical protein